ncbi:Sec-independent protein translocase protein TatB [Actinobacillus pleuropneumoniae]|uniref:Sec-independent protein translocase protein TatB n=1 Tax=Actinobacillus pleuropneumoniae serotype 5b (strain L20) TaxID=416269 RepID=TATB_ACTP2|nr:Sec-independent protein translocase protein TatB [Actinobacillus pleuropneumoniae]A3N3S4.1 RecName: Full=Sec-independent protein translocase protein TatB [Actinobacillus pleuropneumoniae serovar 5b str. L20]ABN75060.1 sec-independent protein translocase-like protein TatB [Actinobacillus pleuropneumoniae serovar 5b str. L20]EFM95385.1 Sec-independent protein translocase protein tatB [Actinobacillus pleuropneumoniae serovar 10 str. D13039]MEE3682951.1 Sec-independent protein translocase protei
MFDIGFSELVLIFIVGLVVLGPQRLPIAIKTVMGWIRTIRGLAANVQNELAQELKLQELQESIKKAEKLNLTTLSPELSKTVEELKQSAQKMQSDLDAAKGEITKLTDEQVANIQNNIAQEEQNLATVQPETLQKSEENQPLVDTANAEENPSLSPAEIAEQAELDESQFAAYYPPDDDLASPTPSQPQDKQNVS